MSVSTYYSLIDGSVGSAGPILTVTAGVKQQVSTAIPSATTVTIPIDTGTVAAIKGVYLVTDGPLDVRTNTFTGNQVFPFISTTPLVWATSMPNTNPITTAITAGLVCVNTHTTTVNISGNFMIG